MVLELLASSALKYLTYSEKFQFSCVHAHNSLFQLPLAFHLTSLCVLYKLQLHLYNKFFLKTIQYFSKIYSTLFHLHDKSTEKKYINIILHLSIYLSICFIFFFFPSCFPIMLWRLEEKVNQLIFLMKDCLTHWE